MGFRLWMKLNFFSSLGIRNLRLRQSGAASDLWSSIVDHYVLSSRAGAPGSQKIRKCPKWPGSNRTTFFIASLFFTTGNSHYWNNINTDKFEDLSCPIAKDCSISHYICIPEDGWEIFKFYSNINQQFHFHFSFSFGI